jgi:dihydrofolate reductase
MPRAHLPLVIVAAVAENGVIGRSGGLPWRLKSDLARFRAITAGHPVVMGRKTFLSIGKPLRDRTTIVVTRDPAFAAAGIVTAPSLEAAITAAQGDALRRGAAAIIIAGGAALYAATIGVVARRATPCFRPSIRRNGAKPRGTNFRPARRMTRHSPP